MKDRAGRNKTITISAEERDDLLSRIITSSSLSSLDFSSLIDRIIQGDTLSILPLLPDSFADLIIIDPPYNLRRTFGSQLFRQSSKQEYEHYVRSWLPDVCRKLKPNGTLYLCGDWHCTSTLQTVLSEHLNIINRITWQREKGRGATSNWKNSMEDIWYAVADTNDYQFHLDAVKVRRIVKAPYRQDGKPKDWHDTNQGKFRDTCPGNFWDDISVPFWSMPENTDHPTQKPEKLYAKLILASSSEGDVVFDPFLGSGTSAVVAKKLGRHYIGIELDEEYCLLSQKRLLLADTDKSIQGFYDGVFWERNSTTHQNKLQREKNKSTNANNKPSK